MCIFSSHEEPSMSQGKMDAFGLSDVTRKCYTLLVFSGQSQGELFTVLAPPSKWLAEMSVFRVKMTKCCVAVGAQKKSGRERNRDGHRQYSVFNTLRGTPPLGCWKPYFMCFGMSDTYKDCFTKYKDKNYEGEMTLRTMFYGSVSRKSFEVVLSAFRFERQGQRITSTQPSSPATILKKTNLPPRLRYVRRVHGKTCDLFRRNTPITRAKVISVLGSVIRQQTAPPAHDIYLFGL